MNDVVGSASAEKKRSLTGRFLMASIYVAIVAAVAACGFLRGSTWIILLAAAVSLPASAAALPGYYLIYGLLALVTDANPSGASGSTSCTAAGDCTSATAGDPAVWFQVTTDVIGILALTCAAVLNAFLYSKMTERRRRRNVDPDKSPIH